MTIAGFLVFLAAYVVAVAAPGPGVAAVLARALAHGLTGMLAFIGGFAAGDMVWFLVAATGLAVVAQTYGEVIALIKYAGALYLVYLAWKLWTAPAVPVEAGPAGADESPWRLFLGSLALTLGNPKPIVFFMAVLPAIVDLTTLTPLAAAEIAAVIVVVIYAVLGAYAVAAHGARQLFRDASALKILNRTTAVVMAGAAAVVARG